MISDGKFDLMDLVPDADPTLTVFWFLKLYYTSKKSCPISIAYIHTLHK